MEDKVREAQFFFVDFCTVGFLVAQWDFRIAQRCKKRYKRLVQWEKFEKKTLSKYQIHKSSNLFPNT